MWLPCYAVWGYIRKHLSVLGYSLIDGLSETCCSGSSPQHFLNDNCHSFKSLAAVLIRERTYTICTEELICKGEESKDLISEVLFKSFTEYQAHDQITTPCLQLNIKSCYFSLKSPTWRILSSHQSSTFLWFSCLQQP